MGLAPVLHKADIKKEISMTKGDVSTEEKEATSQRPADNQSVEECPNWCLGRVLSSRPQKRSGLGQLSNNRDGCGGHSSLTARMM